MTDAMECIKKLKEEVAWLRERVAALEGQQVRVYGAYFAPASAWDALRVWRDHEIKHHW